MVSSDIKKHVYHICQTKRGIGTMRYIADFKTLEKINEIDLAEAVSVREKMWTPERILRISYLDGETIEHKRSKEIANEGMDYAKRN